MPTNLTSVLQEILQNTSNLNVLQQHMTPDATYVSLNFDNPELKKVMPWTGTHKGPESLQEVFGAIQRYWKTLDFKVTDAIEQGNRVAYDQFLEDSYGTAGSLKTGGAKRFHSDPSGREVEV
jgi:hypothetical protein